MDFHLNGHTGRKVVKLFYYLLTILHLIHDRYLTSDSLDILHVIHEDII